MATRRRFLATLTATPLLLKAATVRATVAQDGTGDFPTIQRAVDHVLDNPPSSIERIILDIRPGIYKERVKVPPTLAHLTFKGTDAAKTVITSNMSAAAAGGTFFSSITEIGAPAFEAENITFENTFGTGSQAVAISVHSDNAAFRNCRFLGWQDTLYAAAGRQRYTDCYIEGHVDFIFGNASAVFERCTIQSKGAGFITAHSRTAPDQPTAYIFRDCKLTAAGDTGKGVYLGRPWRAYARVVFVDCWMGPHIRPEGWDNWGKSENEKTAFFAEIGSTGPGANPTARAPWSHQLTPAEAAPFRR